MSAHEVLLPPNTNDETTKTMPLFDSNNQKIFLGFLAGAATGALATKLAPNVAPKLALAAKPAMKQMIKAALMGAEAGREFLAHAKEALEDATAEASAELKTEPAEPSVVKPVNGSSTVSDTASEFAAAMSRKGVGSA